MYAAGEVFALITTGELFEQKNDAKECFILIKMKKSRIMRPETAQQSI